MKRLQKEGQHEKDYCGTFSLDHDTCVSSVKTFLENGGRLIVTAYMYGNEDAVGEGVRQAMEEYGIPREDLDNAEDIVIDRQKLANQRMWKVDEYSFEAIADRLNGMDVLSPMEYKRSNGEKFTTGFRTKKRSKWAAHEAIILLRRRN